MSRIHFLNVDEGDCSIIQHEDGKATIIDVCSAHQENLVEKAFAGSVLQPIKGNYQQKNIPENPLSYLKRIGIKSIFRYVQTHPDMDHMDGLKCIADNFPIYNFWDTNNTKTTDFSKPSKYKKEDWDCYQELRKSTESPKALYYYSGQENKYYSSDDNGNKTDDYIEILSPTKELVKTANEKADWNDSSYVLLYHSHGFKILFCGDAGDSTFEHIIASHKEKISNIDILIAPHHGRRAQISDYDFLSIMKPKLTLMGNAKNQYLAYEKYNPHLLNNQCGNIILEVSQGKLLVYASNRVFVTKIALENKNKLTFKHPQLDAWLLFTINR